MKSYKLKIKKLENKLRKKVLSKKVLSKKVLSKKVLKDDKLAVRIKEYKAPSIWMDENRFFKSEMEKTKKSMIMS